MKNEERIEEKDGIQGRRKELKLSGKEPPYWTSMFVRNPDVSVAGIFRSAHGIISC